jgi:hypothetical protein
MWVNKNDIFADDKIQEFKASNPDSEVHIRGTLSTESPHPSALTCCHLLQQHTLAYMSSDGRSDLAFKYPAGAVTDSPEPTPSIPVVNFATMQPLSPNAPVFSP